MRVGGEKEAGESNTQDLNAPTYLQTTHFDQVISIQIGLASSSLKFNKFSLLITYIF